MWSPARPDRWNSMRISWSSLLAMFLSVSAASAAIVERVARVLIFYPLDEGTLAPVVVGESAAGGDRWQD